MIFEIVQAKAFRALDQEDAAQALIGVIQIIIDYAIIIASPVHDFVIGVLHSACHGFHTRAFTCR